MEAVIYTVSLFIIAVTCFLAVLSSKFEDNLMQRVGFSVSCLGASTRLLEVYGQYPNETNARYMFTYGVAIICVGTVWKFWRKP